MEDGNMRTNKVGNGAKVFATIFTVVIMSILIYYVWKFVNGVEEEFGKIGDGYAKELIREDRMHDSLTNKLLKDLYNPESYAEVRTSYEELKNHNYLVKHTYLHTNRRGETITKRIIFEMDTTGRILRTVN